MNYVDMGKAASRLRPCHLASLTIALVVTSLYATAADTLPGLAEDVSGQAAVVAEVLSVRETSGFLADPAVVDAHQADLEQIYALYPDLATIGARPAAANSIIARVHQSADRAAVIAAFPEELQFVSATYHFHDWVVFSFGTMINAENLARWAEASIPGILDATPDFFFGDGNDVVYHPEADLYAFKEGWGDCPSGCINVSWRFVLMSATGPIEVPYADLGAIFTGALEHAPAGDMQMSRGDEIPLEWLTSAAATVVHETATGDVAIAESIKLRGAEDFGTYRVTVERPYGLPAVENRITLVEREGGSLLHGLRDLSGWVLAGKLGWVQDQSFPWVWHNQHGWIYVHPQGGNEHHNWIYDREIGWEYVQGNSYPWIYSTEHGWMYYQLGSASPRQFFVAAEGGWMAVN